jgi:hypothetical protein
MENKKQMLEAYVVNYTITSGSLGSGFGSDKFYDNPAKAIYMHAPEPQNDVLIKRSSKASTLISGPVNLMYAAYVGEEAKKKWSDLLKELKIDEDSKKIKKIKVQQSVLEWAKSLHQADNPPKDVTDLLAD